MSIFACPPLSTLFPYTTLFRSRVDFVLEDISIDAQQKFHSVSAGHVLEPVAHMPRRNAVEFLDRKSTRLNSSHSQNSYALFCLKKKKTNNAAVRVQIRLIYHPK